MMEGDAALRRQIDEIDAAMHDLLMRRAAVEVAGWRALLDDLFGLVVPSGCDPRAEW